MGVVVRWEMAEAEGVGATEKRNSSISRDKLDARASDDGEELARRVEAIIAESHSSNKRENQRAAELMWALSSGGATEATEALVTRGAIEACMHLLAAGTDLYIHRCSLSAIANLLDIDERTRSMLLDEGGLQLVLEAFRSRDREMQKCGLRCIMSLAKHLETRQILMNEKGFVHTLISMGHNPYDSATAYFVASTLDSVTRKEEFAHKVAAHENTEGEKDTLKCLMRLASNNQPEDVVAEAVRVIFNLTVSVENATASKNDLRDRLEQPEVMDMLRGLAADTKPIEVRCVAADTLAILTNHQDQIQELEGQYGLNFSYGQLEINEDNNKEDSGDQ